MNKTRTVLTTGLKVAICLLAILAILYAQTWVESFGWSYGGPLHTQVGYRSSSGDSDLILDWDIGGFDVPTRMPNPHPDYQQNIEQGWILVLALLLMITLFLWHKLWTEPHRRERLLAAELRPMYRLVRSPPRQTKKRNPHPSGAPVWL